MSDPVPPVEFLAPVTPDEDEQDDGGLFPVERPDTTLPPHP